MPNAILGKNKKRLFYIIFGVVFLILGFGAIPAPKAEAMDYNWLHVKLDTETGGTGTPRDGSCGSLENCAQLWQFHGFNSLTHDGLEAASTPSGYQCPIWLVEETYGVDDGGGVLWTKQGNKLSKSGSSINSDLTDKAYTTCANTTLASGWYCNTVDADKPKNFTYGLMDNIGGAEDITLSNATATTYLPDVDILCAGANNWKTCESNSCASVVTANDWACNGTTKVWSLCVSPQTCNVSTGACAAANTLVLSASASPTSIQKSGTSTVTFTVKSSGSAVSGAVVNTITQTGGSSVTTTNCNNTDTNGQCTATFTAGTTIGTAVVSSTKATKTSYTDSSSISVNILVTGIPCSSLNCSSAVTTDCDCVDESATAGKYCCPASSKTTTPKYVFDNATDCNTYCATCSYSNDLRSSGNCNYSDRPCSKIETRTSGVRTTTNIESSSARPQLLATSPTYNTTLVICNASTTCTGETKSFGNEIYDCSPSAPWTIFYKGTQCLATVNAGAICPVCNSGVDCNGNQKCVSGQWQDCPIGETCSGGSCVTVGPVCNNNSVMDNGETGIDCGGGGCPACPPPPAGPCASGTTNYRSPLSYCSIQELIQAATGWVLGLVSSIIILFLVYGGIMYTMAAGDETKMESAKNIIYYAILGLAIVLVSYTLITEVKTILKVK
ncbi:hypothetical protein KJ695_03315 [Patescibacteria group bacterium]|nr:hypothetical protein [Patescibacteria group bacterium]